MADRQRHQKKAQGLEVKEVCLLCMLTIVSAVHQRQGEWKRPQAKTSGGGMEVKEE